jgi:hypothetical protein
MVCNISGHGDDLENPGCERGKKAYDLLIQSRSWGGTRQASSMFPAGRPLRSQRTG